MIVFLEKNGAILQAAKASGRAMFEAPGAGQPARSSGDQPLVGQASPSVRFVAGEGDQGVASRLGAAARV
jgi:hypothetical protein